LRFSRRTPESLTQNALTRVVAELRAQGRALHDLTLTNPTQAGILYPDAALMAALGDERALRYEPSAKGLSQAREAVARWHAGLDAERLILAGSTSEAYGWLFKLLCEPGEAVLAPKPSYPLFDCLAELEAVGLKHYPLVEAEGWRIDFEGLKRAATAEVRAIVAVNPNNPTGSYVDGEDWRRLLEFAGGRGLAVIVDEVFHDYDWRGGVRASGFEEQETALVFAMSGLSKAIGLPQMKLGWVYVSGPEKERREAIERLEWIADAYLPVSAPVQYAAEGWLEAGRGIQRVIRGRCEEGLEALRRSAGRVSGVRLRGPEGGWAAVVEVPRVRTDEEWAIALAGEGYVVQPGYFYDFEGDGRLVVSLLARAEELEAGVEAMGRLI
jgi:alanine-synthesizing transaminase